MGGRDGNVIEALHPDHHVGPPQEAPEVLPARRHVAAGDPPGTGFPGVKKTPPPNLEKKANVSTTSTNYIFRFKDIFRIKDKWQLICSYIPLKSLANP